MFNANKRDWIDCIKSRKQPLEKILPIAEGRVWAGGTARQIGLVDQFGGLDDALAYAAERAKLGRFSPAERNSLIALLLAGPASLPDSIVTRIRGR